MSHYIFSTHTNPICYVEYAPQNPNSPKNHNSIIRRFTVAGGHGLCNKHMFTPQGVVTTVDRQEDMDWLNSLESFKNDIINGFIRVTKRREEPEKIVKKDMNTRDGFRTKNCGGLYAK